VHRRTQASRASGIELFGIDIDADMLRSITGYPRPEVPLISISGCEGTVAISVRATFAGLSTVSHDLLKLYKQRKYKDHFDWVDNISPVKDPALLNTLNETLVADVSSPNPSAILVPPEPLDWQRVDGFSYTRRRSKAHDPDLDLTSYLSTLRASQDITLERLQRDSVLLFCDGRSDVEHSRWPAYRCLLYEGSVARKRFILSNGNWYQVEPTYAKRIERIITRIPLSTVDLPDVRRRPDGKLEHEGDYNARAARDSKQLAFMDKKFARCEATTTMIEICDLFSENGEFIHVKHRKGGSSSLSHLLAQGRMSAEALLADEQFRRESRAHLKDIGNKWERKIPIARPQPSNCTVTYAILGADKRPALGLPFFTQINLAKTYLDLRARGLNVQLCGVPEAQV
jgi:uncharacterized protein (TIGR04141 family)